MALVISPFVPSRPFPSCLFEALHRQFLSPSSLSKTDSPLFDVPRVSHPFPLAYMSSLFVFYSVTIDLTNIIFHISHIVRSNFRQIENNNTHSTFYIYIMVSMQNYFKTTKNFRWIKKDYHSEIIINADFKDITVLHLFFIDIFFSCFQKYTWKMRQKIHRASLKIRFIRNQS